MKDKDRYGRTVGVVMAGNENVNLALVSAGLAWWYQLCPERQKPSERRTDGKEGKAWNLVATVARRTLGLASWISSSAFKFSNKRTPEDCRILADGKLQQTAQFHLQILPENQGPGVRQN